MISYVTLDYMGECHICCLTIKVMFDLELTGQVICFYL